MLSRVLLEPATTVSPQHPPSSQVEESFNIQAIHDILYHTTDLHAYDHHLFPGVVPRTFLGTNYRQKQYALHRLHAPAIRCSTGALVVAAASVVPLRLAQGLLGATKLMGLYIARLALVRKQNALYKVDGCANPIVHKHMHSLPHQGTMWYASYLRLQRAVGRYLGPDVAVAFVLVAAVQFHLPFYASRTLPNVLAMPLTNMGLALWLESTMGALHGTPQQRRKAQWAVLLLTAAAVVFRCDMVLLLGLVGLHMLSTGVCAMASVSIVVCIVSITISTIRRSTWFPGCDCHWLCKCVCNFIAHSGH